MLQGTDGNQRGQVIPVLLVLLSSRQVATTIKMVDLQQYICAKTYSVLLSQGGKKTFQLDHVYYNVGPDTINTKF